MKLTVQAPAKINLYLDVVKRRENGYHDIESIMHTVSLSDTVTVELTDKDITLSSNFPHVPTDEKNIAYKAAKAFFEAANIEGGASIHIEKHIPVASGLAGGSTDAAATLKALNELCGYPLSEEELLRVGGGLGADVPFCILGGCAICEGLGEVMTPLPPLKGMTVLITRGGEGVSTPRAYGMIDELYGEGVNCRHADFDSTVNAIKENSIGALFSGAYNIFEEVILPVHSTAKAQKDILLEHGADLAMMSGSGPAVFGFFKNTASANAAASAIRKFGARAFICETV
ncbi:MAG: 4-(cytidine 5'-diphospho)-2-C-methyl-D-erythritol kinase [Ruminococcaceae bacterium]|nr:4-(cytidine 5'-diphospho)-2-C-methyl-D-erythritol kinase [Oscillospiraceae bacterium]